MAQRTTKNLARFPATDPGAYNFYRRVIQALNRAGMPFLLGGGVAFEFHTQITRSIKDLDIFVCRRDLEEIFQVLRKAGFRTELTFPHWLGKIFYRDDFIDVIFSSGNGLCVVDEDWFRYSAPGTFFDLPVRFSPVEEMIWSKAFVMERERYDGGDIAHLILKCSDRLDWNRLLKRFGAHWRVLLVHLILFGYIYPRERLRVPEPVMRELLLRLEGEMKSPGPEEEPCHGPLLSRTQYRIDVEEMGYKDGRLTPDGNMTPEQTARWTAAAELEEAKKKLP
ncbi:MAG TPA: hypothetical protein VFU31_13260 [Candidatus Binatia bacterium]|nr:hypothetical protein [Candidatus Binatia bacterium]